MYPFTHRAIMARRNKVRWGIVVEQLTVLYQNLKSGEYGEFHWLE
ncbi:hypothetical protein SSU05_0207 [Streptococcus suis 05ZYH33]|nr:hypothetical protein SSU05_0207 [Streptococcus suis 05ZYH33]